jgi:hypothetical protein
LIDTAIGAKKTNSTIVGIQDGEPMTKRFCAAAVFALLTVTAPAHALVETESLDINYPGNLTLTGNLDIQLAAPSVSAYLPQSLTALASTVLLLSHWIRPEHPARMGTDICIT